MSQLDDEADRERSFSAPASTLGGTLRARDQHRAGTCDVVILAGMPTAHEARMLFEDMIDATFTA